MYLWYQRRPETVNPFFQGPGIRIPIIVNILQGELFLDQGSSLVV